MTEPKYIDAKEFWNRLISVSENDWVGFDTIDEILSEMSTADVAEVRHGRWIIEYGDGHKVTSLVGGNCSRCGYFAPASRYCPNCGALMMDENATQHTECVVNLYTETKLRFVLDECIEDEELIEKILKALDEVEE